VSPKQQRKMPPAKIPCTCKDGKLVSTYPRTTHDGRVCDKCKKAVLTCFWCLGIICDWQQGEENSELEYMPYSCPHCGVILKCR
jgi:hypothetical protein